MVGRASARSRSTTDLALLSFLDVCLPTGILIGIIDVQNLLGALHCQPILICVKSRWARLLDRQINGVRARSAKDVPYFLNCTYKL